MSIPVYPMYADDRHIDICHLYHSTYPPPYTISCTDDRHIDTDIVTNDVFTCPPSKIRQNDKGTTSVTTSLMTDKSHFFP